MGKIRILLVVKWDPFFISLLLSRTSQSLVVSIQSKSWNWKNVSFTLLASFSLNVFHFNSLFFLNIFHDSKTWLFLSFLAFGLCWSSFFLSFFVSLHIHAITSLEANNFLTFVFLWIVFLTFLFFFEFYFSWKKVFSYESKCKSATQNKKL